MGQSPSAAFESIPTHLDKQRQLAAELDDCWPWVQVRLASFLRSRGAESDLVWDITQEVAARALATGVSYRCPDDLLRWATTVASNLLVDDWRAGRRHQPLDGLDYSSAEDIAHTVERRLAWNTVMVGVAQLSAADRTALVGDLFGESSGPVDRRDSTRRAVARHRARRRLRALVGNVLGWLGGWLWFRRPRLAATAAVAVAPLIMAAALLNPPPAISGGTGGGVDERRKVPRSTVDAPRRPPNMMMLSQPSPRGRGDSLSAAPYSQETPTPATVPHVATSAGPLTVKAGPSHQPTDSAPFVCFEPGGLPIPKVCPTLSASPRPG